MHSVVNTGDQQDATPLAAHHIFVYMFLFN